MQIKSSFKISFIYLVTWCRQNYRTRNGASYQPPQIHRKLHSISYHHRRNLTCVVFPDPVSPTNTRHWFLFSVSINVSLYSHTGSVVRFLYSSQYFGENGIPTKHAKVNLQFREHTLVLW